MIVTGASAQSMGPPALLGYVARIDLVSSDLGIFQIYRFVQITTTITTNKYQ